MESNNNLLGRFTDFFKNSPSENLESTNEYFRDFCSEYRRGDVKLLEVREMELIRRLDLTLTYGNFSISQDGIATTSEFTNGWIVEANSGISLSQNMHDFIVHHSYLNADDMFNFKKNVEFFLRDYVTETYVQKIIDNTFCLNVFVTDGVLYSFYSDGILCLSYIETTIEDEHIEDIVSLFMANQSNFSAYDVNQELHKHYRFSDDHATLKNMTHKVCKKLMAINGYERVMDEEGKYYIYKKIVHNFVEVKFGKESSHISEVWYNKESEILVARMVGGYIYLHYGVSEGLIEQWQLADSVGGFYSSHIENFF